MTRPSTTPRSNGAYTGFERLPISGQWREGGSERRTRDKNPYTGDTLVEIRNANREDVDQAYAAAAGAQRSWCERPPGERAGIMRRAAALIEARRDEVMGWLIREAGSTRIKASLEWDAVHSVMLEAAALPHLVEGRIIPTDVPGKESRVYRRPVGVVAVVSPWNWPMQLTGRSLFPALAVGNAVVVKPASDTPVTGGLLLARLLEEAGLPPGTVNVLVGSGSEIGDAFVSHPTPRVVSFTGSTPVGRHVARLAVEAPVMKRLELELGGNSPFVVLEDANLERAIEAAVFGKFLHQGQICMIANRLIVHTAVYDDFVNGFAARVRELKVGDPDAADTMIGPIINQSQMDGLMEHVRRARESGARELVGGEPRGLTLPPYVFADVANDDPVAREELFGPIAPVIRAQSDEDALRLANDTSYGLSSSVFTEDVERGLRFAQRIEAGMTHVNDQPVNDLPFNPFGGEKNSGIGRFNGRWAIDAFTTDHWITLQHAPREYPRSSRDIGGPWGGG